MAKTHADIPGTGPDPLYHDKIRAWWIGQGNKAFHGQATPAIEAVYLEAHPDEAGDQR